uniref:Uncharacterized protein n=1 Tax=Helianthus annuus TaxID=4232 RepID=A0A1Y3BW50_HELAN
MQDELGCQEGGVFQLLLRLARSLNEGLQLEAKGDFKSFDESAFARSVLERCITVLASLAKSTNRFVAEEAAEGFGIFLLGTSIWLFVLLLLVKFQTFDFLFRILLIRIILIKGAIFDAGAINL